MADVYGRLTGRAGVCLSTLGPGATNLVTGVADANMDMAPLVAISGQASTTRLHKESHQVIDLVNLFQPITKYGAQVRMPGDHPGDRAQGLQGGRGGGAGRLLHRVPAERRRRWTSRAWRRCAGRAPACPTPTREQLDEVAALLDASHSPLILAGHGVIRMDASEQLVAFAETLNIPVVTTFMAKGVIPASHPLLLGTAGLQAPTTTTSAASSRPT